MFFYYVRNYGKIYPRISDRHPSEFLDKPRNIVGKIIQLPRPVENFPLNSLVQLYPYEEPKK